MSNGKVQDDPPRTLIDYKKADDFAHLYANNTQLLASNWDLELAFGQLDQKQGPNVVVQTASVTLPWAAAKVLWYFLSLHVMGHEAEFGRVVIPAGIIPEFPAQKPKEFLGATDEAFQIGRKFYLDFVERNPEAATSQKLHTK